MIATQGALRFAAMDIARYIAIAPDHHTWNPVSGMLVTAIRKGMSLTDLASDLERLLARIPWIYFEARCTNLQAEDEAIFRDLRQSMPDQARFYYMPIKDDLVAYVLWMRLVEDGQPAQVATTHSKIPRTLVISANDRIDMGALIIGKTSHEDVDIYDSPLEHYTATVGSRETDLLRLLRKVLPSI